jgi:hypothetical protein
MDELRSYEILKKINTRDIKNEFKKHIIVMYIHETEGNTCGKEKETAYCACMIHFFPEILTEKYILDIIKKYYSAKKDTLVNDYIELDGDLNGEMS